MSLTKIHFSAYLRIFFFSFKKAHSNCFTNPWIFIFIPQFLLLFHVLGTMGSESRALLAPTLLKALTLYQTT